MQKTRSWQESFGKLELERLELERLELERLELERLELSRREENALHDSEVQQIRMAEAAYAKASADAVYGKASAEVADKPAMSGFMLDGEQAGCDEVPVVPGKAAKQGKAVKPKRGARSASRKAPPRKRAAPRRVSKVANSKAAKPKAVGAKVPEPLTTRRSAAPQEQEPALVAAASVAAPELAPTPELVIASASVSPQPPAETLLITPLPRHASLAPYRKPGLFGLIGSWLRLAARRSPLPKNLRKPAQETGKPRDDISALQAENRELRRQLEALLARQEADAPPWLTTPAGDAPARPRRRGGTRP